MRIQVFVKKSGMTMRAFAQILGINYCYLSEIANGIRPSKNIANKIEFHTKGSMKASTLLRQKRKNSHKYDKAKKREKEIAGVA